MAQVKLKPDDNDRALSSHNAPQRPVLLGDLPQTAWTGSARGSVGTETALPRASPLVPALVHRACWVPVHKSDHRPACLLRALSPFLSLSSANLGRRPGRMTVLCSCGDRAHARTPEDVSREAGRRPSPHRRWAGCRGCAPETLWTPGEGLSDPRLRVKASGETTGPVQVSQALNKNTFKNRL